MAKETISKKAKKELIDMVTVRPGTKVSLKKDFDAGYKLPWFSKEDAKIRLQEGVELLAEYQDKLYASDRYSLLLVFQALDAAGKDGTIKHVMSGINPQGCQVYSFKAPSEEDLDHDYLWRCMKALPERGRIGIFNRSYYEEVLVARVHPEILSKQKLPDSRTGKSIWQRRFEEINNFEKYLDAQGIVILKFFLNVSKSEQKKRFLERIDRPEKNWKFSVSDVKERAHWSEYMKAYEDCFTNTSTKWAPWHVIPADHKPTARLLVGLVIYNTLQSLNLKYPTVSKEHKAELLKAKALLEGER